MTLRVFTHIPSFVGACAFLALVLAPLWSN